MLVTSGMRKFTGKIQDSYADGGAIVEQAIAGIRTVYTFSLQNRFSVLYKEQVHKAYLVGRRRAVTLGLGFGVFMFLLFSSYGLAFWYGYTLVLEQIDGMDGAGILTVFMSMMVGKYSIYNIYNAFPI
jgi:hypothetical protein